MSSKNTYRVGTDGNANYATLTEIPAYITAQGDNTILLYPGTYDAPTDAVWKDLAIVGVGDRDEIVINGDVTIANTSTGMVTFENVSFVGSNGSTTGDKACVTKNGAASLPIHFKRVKMSNAEHGVLHSGEMAFATTNQQIILDNSDLTAIDQAIVSNANVGINFSMLSLASNAYFRSGVASPTITVTVRASTCGGANVGNNTETVLALIS